MTSPLPVCVTVEVHRVGGDVGRTFKVPCSGNPFGLTALGVNLYFPHRDLSRLVFIKFDWICCELVMALPLLTAVHLPFGPYMCIYRDIYKSSPAGLNPSLSVVPMCVKIHPVNSLKSDASCLSYVHPSAGRRRATSGLRIWHTETECDPEVWGGSFPFCRKRSLGCAGHAASTDAWVWHVFPQEAPWAWDWGAVYHVPRAD